MPPTMGAAMRFMTSEPVPLPTRIGNRPAMMTVAVMALGRRRCSAPSMIGVCNSARVAGCKNRHPRD